uniref:Transmembrane protein 18 n=1 Tax=Amphora coffeiformis TaxID=265554 RepID=A0A7S3L4C7_9STRA
MSESYFAKLANEILDASEKLTNRFEEGLNILLGELDSSKTSGSGDTAPPQPEATDNEFEGWDDTEGMDDPSPLAGIAESVMGDIMASQKGPETFTEQLDAFRHAITWSEPFILSVLAFQIVMFMLTLYVGRRDATLAPRVTMLVLIGVVVRSAEYINVWAAREWRSFATQNYFDQQGIFISIFLCAPLLLDSFIMLVMFLREAADLLIQVKRSEMKKKSKDAKAAERRSKKDQ